MKASRSVLLAIAAAIALAAPSLGFAQDDEGGMTFGEEEAKEVQEGGDEEGSGDEEGMTFGEEEAEQAQGEDAGKDVVGVLAAPSPAVSSSQRQNLQDELLTQMKNVPDIQIQSGSALLSALRERTVETCVTEALCLGTVGDEAGVDYVAMARVSEREDGYAIDVDYFLVGERRFEDSRTETGLGTVAAAKNQIGPMVEDMFDLGTRERPDVVEDDTGAATTIVAISSAVLSAGGIAGGIVFGNRAKQAEDELNSHEKNENGNYEDLTQTKARQMLEDAQGKAQTANIFYGLAGVFAVTSGVLFIVDSGNSGSEKDARPAKGLQRIRVTPTAGPDGAGFSAQIRF